MRYAEMKDSGIEWIGEIPKHWLVRQIKAHFSIVTGNGFPIELQGKDNGDYPVYKASDISLSTKTTSTALNWISEDEATQNRFNIIPAGSIIFAKIGEAMKKNHRTITTVNCCVDNNCQGVIGHKINVSFSYYLFSHIKMQWFDNAGTIPCVNNQKLRACKIPVPPVEEQEAIAAYLDEKCGAIDTIIEEAKASIEEYKAWKASVIFEAVTKGLDSNAEMKDSGFSDIGMIPKTWKLVRLKHRYNIFCGATPSDNPENWNGDIAWIGPADMDDFGSIKEGKRKITQTGYESCGTNIVPVGSIILSTRAPIGKIQVAENDLCTNQGCKSLVKRYSLDSALYLAYYLFSIRERLEVAGTGTTFKELSTTNLKNMPFVLPSPSEQSAIVAYLDKRCAAIDGIIAEKQVLIDELETYKKSLIYETVTGKRSVC